jgi:hypothetical protein
MSIHELAWRAVTTAALPLRTARRRTLTPPTWEHPEWEAAVRALVAARAERLLPAAERIARGELEFWGHRANIDLRRTDWSANPVVFDSARAFPEVRSDWKPILELHRQQHLFPLAAGAALTGRRDWGSLAAQHLLGWVEQNPPDRAGPGWMSGYETAHRLVGWTFAVPLLRPWLSADEQRRLGESFASQSLFTALRPSRFSSANNHRLAELTGLLAAATLGSTDLSWGPLWQELEVEVTRQTYADGGSREQASAYFLYVLDIVFVAMSLATATRRPLGRLEERLAAMLDWLAAVADAAGDPPPVGDDAEDRMLRVDYFARPRASELAERARDFLGAAGTQHARTSRVLGDSGYAILRSRDVRVVFDVGELGLGALAAHGHADALSVTVDTHNGTILRDSGTGTYAAGPLREALRATESHNTVVVDGRSQARALGPHLWGRRFRTTIEASRLDPVADVVRASHDGYAGVVHTRTVAFVKPDLVVVVDSLRSCEAHEATLVWQTHGPEPIAVVAIPEAVRSDGHGLCSPRYGAVAEAPRLTWRAHGKRVVFVTALSIGGGSPSLGVTEQEQATVVEVSGPRRARIVERWSGDAAEIQV